MTFETPTSITLNGHGGSGGYSYTILDMPAHGSLSGTAPDLTYTPAMEFKGQDSFTFQVEDSEGGTATGTINITIASDLQAVDQTLYTPFETPVEITLMVSGGEAPYTFTNLTEDEFFRGTITGTPPNLSYTQNEGVSGTSRFTYTVIDANGFEDTGSVRIVTAAPLQIRDRYHYLNGAASLNIPVSASGGRQPYQFDISSPAQGSLEGQSPVLTYMPAANFGALDTFTVTVTDANGTVDSATVHITDAPILQATPNSFEVLFEQTAMTTLSATGGTLPYTYEVLEAPQFGILSGTAPNLIYTPDTGFSGIDRFRFSVTDAHGYSAANIITLLVSSVSSLPDQTLTAFLETPLEIGIDVSGGLEPYTYSVTAPANGSISGTPPILLYVPDNGFVGVDSFIVEVTDARGDVDSATVTVEIKEPTYVSAGNSAGLVSAIETANSSPNHDTIIIAPGTYTFATPHDNDLIGNALPVIQSPIKIIANGGPAIINRTGIGHFRFFTVEGDGELHLQGLTLSNGHLPDNNNEGNGGAIFNRGILRLTEVALIGNIGRLGGAIYNENGTIYITDSDLRNNSASYRGGAINDGGNSTIKGFVSINNSRIIGNSAGQFDGYRTGRDGGGIFSLYRLEINNTILANNSAEGTGGAIYNGTSNSRATIYQSCIAGNSVPEVHTNNNPSPTYSDATHNWWGSAEGPYGTRSYAGHVTASPYLDTPILGCPEAISQTVNTGFETPVNVALAGAGGAPPYTFSAETPPSAGTMSVTGSNLTYTPAASFSGSVNAWFRIEDSAGLPAVARINFLVAPELVVADQSLDTEPNMPLPVMLTANGGLPPYSFAFTNSANGSLSGNAPNIVYTPSNGFSGLDSFQVTVTDANGTTKTVTINIHVFNLAAEDQTLTTAYNTPLELSLLHTGGQSPYTYAITDLPDNGVVFGEGSARVYTPNNGFSGVDSFVFEVTDSVGTVATAAITITVETRPSSTIVVDSTWEEVPLVNNGNCTIAEAITAANTNEPRDNCPAGSASETDIIELPPGTYTFSAPLLPHAYLYFPRITDDVIIRGAGIDATTIAYGGDDAATFFYVNVDVNMKIEAMTIIGSDTAYTPVERGGAIYNRGNLLVYDVRFQRNSSSDIGGAIYTDSGSLGIYNSIFENNRTGISGGAIFSHQPTNLNIQNNVFFNNIAAQGNAIFSLSQVADVNFNCILHTPGSSAVMQNGSASMNARYNWWDAISGPSKAGSGTGAAISTQVIYRPFLHTPPAACTTPIDLLTPVDNTTMSGDEAVTFSWDAVDGATGYEIEITNDLVTQTHIVTGTTSFTPAQPLLPGATKWHVRAMNGGELLSYWSVTYSLNIASALLDAPGLNLTTTSSPTLTWGLLTWATGYQIQIATDFNFSNIVVDEANLSTDTSDFTVPLLTNGIYYWRVRGKRADNTWTGWSEISQFKIYAE